MKPAGTSSFPTAGHRRDTVGGEWRRHSGVKGLHHKWDDRLQDFPIVVSQIDPCVPPRNGHYDPDKKTLFNSDPRKKSAQGQRGREKWHRRGHTFPVENLTHVERMVRKKVEPFELATEAGHGLENIVREISDSRIAGWRGFKSMFLGEKSSTDPSPPHLTLPVTPRHTSSQPRLSVCALAPRMILTAATTTHGPAGQVVT